MFTGIIEELGTVTAMTRGAHSSALRIGAQAVLEGTQVGDSIAVNGVCLTVTECDGTCFCADVMHETLDRSSLGALTVGSVVNLERAMPANGRFGGHIVSGHIDGTGTIRSMVRDDTAIRITVSNPQASQGLVVEKGSVAIDGISLTVSRAAADSFEVSIIPHTQSVTNLRDAHVGTVVNLEFDLIGKYVASLLGVASPAQVRTDERVLTMEFLEEQGF